jgi:hypothetical protein
MTERWELHFQLGEGSDAVEYLEQRVLPEPDPLDNNHAWGKRKIGHLDSLTIRLSTTAQDEADVAAMAQKVRAALLQRIGRAIPITIHDQRTGKDL